MIKKWIEAFRVRTLPLSVSCVFVGAGLAYNYGKFDVVNFLLILTTTILLQILSNLANDYGDFVKGTDNDNRVGPKRTLQSGLITKKHMKIAIFINSILSFISGVILVFISLETKDFISIIIFITLGLLSIIAAIKYTVGKRPYGYSGLGDVFVFSFFGLVGVIGTYYLLTKEFNFRLFIPASAIGFLSASVLNMNNMRDIENDKESNKNTLVVKMGFENAKYYHSTLIMLAFVLHIISLIIFELPKLSYISAIAFVFLFHNVYKTYKTTDSKELDSELKKIALSTFVLSLLFFIGGVIQF